MPRCARRQRMWTGSVSPGFSGSGSNGVRGSRMPLERKGPHPSSRTDCGPPLAGIGRTSFARVMEPSLMRSEEIHVESNLGEVGAEGRPIGRAGAAEGRIGVHDADAVRSGDAEIVGEEVLGFQLTQNREGGRAVLVEGWRRIDLFLALIQDPRPDHEVNAVPASETNRQSQVDRPVGEALRSDIGRAEAHARIERDVLAGEPPANSDRSFHPVESEPAIVM